MLEKRGFSFVYVLVFAIVSTSVAIVILLSYSIVSDTPVRDLVPEAVERFIIPSSNGEKESGGILGNLFGNKKSTDGGSSSGGTTGNPPNNPINNTNITIECNDGIDNDNDFWIDVQDPGCTSINDISESNIYSVRYQCSDLEDNDNDGRKDGDDSDCISWEDDLERDEPIAGGNSEYITPGNGWNNQLTLTPSANGTGPTPIARWDFVPYQTINNGQEIGIGVVAFHIYGIEKVLFAVEGGEWSEVREMTYNPYSRVWEYWIKMRANDFNSDGLKEVRAIVYPKKGQPRVLQGNDLTSNSNGIHSMFINTNKQGSLLTHIRYVDSVNGNDVTGTGTENNPFKTIYVAARDLTVNYGSSDGGVIYLKEGDYYWGSLGTTPPIVTNTRWLTIRPAQGLTKNDVRINGTSSGGLKTKLVKVEDMYVNNSKVDSAGATSIWAENVLFKGDNLSMLSGPLVGTDWGIAIYATNSEYSTMLRAVLGHALGRHLYVHHIGGDMFKNPQLLINVTGEHLIDANPNLSASQGDVHRDVMQGQTALNNSIVYGLKAVKNISGQNFFFTCGSSDPEDRCTSQDIAFVNYITHSESTNPAKYGVSTNHFLIWHMTQGKRISFPGSSNTNFVKTMTYFDIRNGVFGSMSGLKQSEWNINNGQNFAVNNHFVEGNNQYGLNYTTGSSLGELLVRYNEWNSEDNDWHPSPSSMLRGSFRNYKVQKIIPVDLDGREINANGLGAIGSLQ